MMQTGLLIHNRNLFLSVLEAVIPAQGAGIVRLGSSSGMQIAVFTYPYAEEGARELPCLLHKGTNPIHECFTLMT